MSFKVQVDGAFIDAQVDNENGIVTISGISDGAQITAVDYELTDGSLIYPEPSAFIGNWDNNIRFVLSAPNENKSYTVVLSDYVETVDTDGWITGKTASIDPDDKFGTITKHFFFDLKYAAGALGTYEKAIKYVC